MIEWDISRAISSHIVCYFTNYTTFAAVIENLMKYYKSILYLALPIIIGQVGTIITGVADTIMVGQHSTDELAASAFVNNVFNLFMIIGVGFTFNFAPLVGSALAGGDKRSVGQWLKNSLVVNSVLGIILALLMTVIYLFVDHMGQPEELLPLIKPYFIVYGLSIIPVMLYSTYRQFVEAVLKPATSMWIFLIGNALNIIGNYMLIYGKFGMPEMGLFGAGVSTLISRCIMLAAFVAVVRFAKFYREYRQGYAKGVVLQAKIHSLIKVGTPIGLQQGFEAATFSISAIMIGWLGSLDLAAHQVSVSISSVCYMLFLGLGNAVAIRVSYFHGMGDVQSVKKATYAGIILSLFFSIAISIVLYLWTSQITQFFSDDGAVVGIVHLLMPILMVYVFSDGIQIVLTNALRGLADVKYIMYVSAIAYFAIALPVGYFVGFTLGWGISGIWLAYPTGFFFACILFYLRFRKFYRKLLSQ